MKWLVNSGLAIRMGVVLANLCVMAGAAELFTAPGTALGKFNLIVFTIFGAVTILGLALIIQKLLEHVEGQTSRVH